MAPLRAIPQPLRLAAAGAFLCVALSGCTVIAVGAAAVSVTATAVGVAADVAVGTAKLAGKGVSAAYGAITETQPDHSGVAIQYRDSTTAPQTSSPAAAPAPVAPPAFTPQ